MECPPVERRFVSSPIKPSWIPVAVMFFLLVLLVHTDEAANTYHSKYLLLACNVVFSTLISTLVAILAGRSFLSGGPSALLWLGGGLLALGISSMISSVMLGRHLYDAGITTYNIGVAVAGLSNCIGAMKLVLGTEQRGRWSKKGKLITAYGSVVAVIALISWVSTTPLFPPFFDVDYGPTPLRQTVLAIATTQFGVAALLLMLVSRFDASGFLYTYSLGLGLISMGLGGLMGMKGIDTLSNWASRGTQYLGGVYLLAAVYNAVRYSKTWTFQFNSLRETFARHVSLVEHNPDAIMVHANGCYVFANPAAAHLLGASSPDEILSKSVAELVHPDYREVVNARVDEAHHGNSPTEMKEIVMLRLDGISVEVEVTGVSVEYEGQPAVQIVMRDVSMRKKAEAELRALNESLEARVAERTREVQQQADQLRALAAELSQAEQRERKRLAGILHDHIQQLLVSAQLHLALVKRGASEEVEDSIQCLDATLRETLSASRSLTVDLCPPVLHQSGLAAACSWLAQLMEDKHQLKVHFRSTQDAEPTKPEERTFLFESVRELLLNIVKYSGVNKAYLTMVRTAENTCQIILQDQGKGFDLDSINNPGPSSGFGLFSIQQRLLYIGGTMEVESAPGQGTRITLSLPIGQAVSSATEPQQVQGERNKTISFREKGQRVRVLLVDDHRIVRQGLLSLLQFESSIEVVGEADNGRQALELARQCHPDVVVMDVNMPVMDGIEATRNFTKEHPGTKVIALSMHVESNSAKAMRSAGAVAYLPKGGPIEDLVEAIQSCCRPIPFTYSEERCRSGLN